jgi:cytoskeletal protein RodZ
MLPATRAWQMYKSTMPLSVHLYKNTLSAQRPKTWEVRLQLRHHVITTAKAACVTQPEPSLRPTPHLQAPSPPPSHNPHHHHNHHRHPPTTPTTITTTTMSSKPAASKPASEKPQQQAAKKPLEEDDEFEDFPAEGTYLSPAQQDLSPALILLTLTLLLPQTGRTPRPTARAARARISGKRAGTTTRPLTISPLS